MVISCLVLTEQVEGCSYGRACVDLEGGVPGLAHAGGLFGVLQQREACGFEFVEAGDLLRAFLFEQEIDERREVLHVRAEQHGLLRQRGFGGVLAAFGEETFADDDKRGEVLPRGEFAGGVDDEDGRGCIDA